MADLSKISADKAQQIIKALKDGKINSNEAKDLKLTPEEAAALNEAFSSGEARIGDFVLVNKGKSKDGTKQYTQTKKAEPQVPQEEPSLLDKALGKIKKNLSKYAQTFSNAWNNSSGLVETTGAMLSAATQTATDVVKDHANYIEKGVEHVTGSKTAGKIASHVAGVGFVADAAEAVEQVGDWSAGKIRNVAKNYTGTEKQLLEKFADYVDNMNAADIALLFVSGAGVAKGFKELPKVLQLLKGVSLSKVAVPAAGVAAVASMTSCTQEMNLNQVVAIHIPQQDHSKLIAAFEKGIDALKNEIQKLGYDLAKYGDEIIKLLTANNSYLKNLADDMQKNNEDNAKIIEMLTNINTTVDTLTSLVEATNENITINGTSIKKELSAILEAIKNGQVNNEATLNAYMEKLSTLLKTVIDLQGDQIELSKDSNLTMKDILAKLDNIKGTTQEKLAAILAVLGDIKSIGEVINGKLDAIINKIENQFADNKAIKAALEKIEQYLKQHNDKADVTNNLLTALLDKVDKCGLSEEALQKLLDAIANNGSKIDSTNSLLEKMSKQDVELQKEILNYIAAVGFEMNGHLDKILDAINKGNADLTEIKKTLTLLEKIANQNAQFHKEVLNYIAAVGFEMNGQLNKILEAINSGKADVNEIKNLLAQLNKNVEKNGAENKTMQTNILNAINKLGAGITADLTAILKAINEGGSHATNVEALLNKVLQKMDNNTSKIIDAMSNIKISGGTVDLESVKAMLSELIKLTQKNGNVLSNIDAKMDVINVTTKAIYDKLGDVDQNIKNILNFINKNAGKYDDSKLLEKLDTLMNKLDKILTAIKDHKVTVEVTGKVTCECKCGQNHEGILGDLNKILG